MQKWGQEGVWLSKTSVTHVMLITLASLTLLLYGGNLHSRVILLGAVGTGDLNCVVWII